MYKKVYVNMYIQEYNLNTKIMLTLWVWLGIFRVSLALAGVSRAVYTRFALCWAEVRERLERQDSILHVLASRYL